MDAVGNLSEPITVSFTRPASGPNSIVLNKDYTNKNRLIKEATDVVKLQPGFKFNANETNEFFIARIAQCSSSKNDTIIQDTVKNDITSVFTNNISNNLTINNIIIFPNPTNGVFTVSSQEEITNIIISNISGNIIFSKNNINNNSLQIDITNQMQGIYFIKITTKTNTTTHKIIKL